jgi:hypothetical protein
MTTTTFHTKSGLDRRLTALAVSSFICTSFEAHVSDGEARRQAARQVHARAAALSPDNAVEAERLATAAFDWAQSFAIASGVLA